MTQEQLGALVGRDQTLISKLENGMVDFDMSMADSLAKAFSVPIEQLRPIASARRPAFPILQPRVGGVIRDAPFGPDMVPVLGNASGSSEAIMLNFDSPIGEIKRHPNQSGMSGAFALYARGESMSPRYMSGEAVYAIANKPPQKGQDCIIEMINGESYLKNFLKQTDNEIICRQLNPEREWKRPISEIRSIHAVVGRG